MGAGTGTGTETAASAAPATADFRRSRPAFSPDHLPLDPGGAGALWGPSQGHLGQG